MAGSHSPTRLNGLLDEYEIPPDWLLLWVDDHR
jgi:hypothetical protein